MDLDFLIFLVALLAVAGAVGLAVRRRASAAWMDPLLLLLVLVLAWLIPGPGLVLGLAAGWFGATAVTLVMDVLAGDPRLARVVAAWDALVAGLPSGWHGPTVPAGRTVLRVEGGGLPTVESLLALPPGGLDLARAALVVGAETDRDLNPAGPLGEIDRLVSGVARRLEGIHDPHLVVRGVVSFLFGLEGFRAEEGDPRRRDLDGLLLHRVLSRRRGHCLGLTTLFLSVTGRLGLPFHGVSVPGHVFVRWDDGHIRLNVETTRGGDLVPDEVYRARYRVGEREERGGVWLGNLWPREILVEILHNRAAALYRAGRVAEARRDLTRVTEASANFASAQGSMAALSLALGDPERAVIACRRAVALDRACVVGHLRLGEAYLRLGRPARAAVAFRAAARLDEGSGLARTGLGRAWSRLGRSDRALACHRGAVEVDPACAEAWNNLGVCMRGDGDGQGAVDSFREATRRDPRLWIARENLVRLLTEMGRDRDAAREARRLPRGLDSGRPADPRGGLAAGLTVPRSA